MSPLVSPDVLVKLIFVTNLKGAIFVDDVGVSAEYKQNVRIIVASTLTSTACCCGFEYI